MAPYPRLSFVVATLETKGKAGFASGLVSEINAHTAKNAHARKRIAKEQASKIANAIPAQKRHLAAATDCACRRRQCDAPVDDESGLIFVVGQAHQDGCTKSICLDDTTITTHRTKATALSYSSQRDLLCCDISLKSMVCLPVALSTKEIGLIQFCKRKISNLSNVIMANDRLDLTYGRRMQLGTSETPKYDPSIDVMQKLIEVSPLYSLVHIVISQFLLSGIMQEEMPFESYKYQAEAYRIVNKRIIDSAIPLAHKIFDLIQLTMLEFSLGRRKQSTLHLEALENFVRTHGGMSIFLDPFDHSTLSMEPRFYMGMFLRVPMPVKTLPDLRGMLQEMLEYHKRIRNWLALQQEHRSKSDDTFNDESSQHAAKLALRPLRNYLEAFGRDDSSKSPSKKMMPAYGQAHICSWMICMTLVEHNICGYDAVMLLQEIQSYMQGSCEDGQNVNNPFSALFVGTTVNTISYVRRNKCPARPLEELNICQAGITALRCYCFADPHFKKILARKLCACVFSSIENCSEDTLAPSFVSDLHDVVVDNWLYA